MWKLQQFLEKTEVRLNVYCKVIDIYIETINHKVKICKAWILHEQDLLKAEKLMHISEITTYCKGNMPD